jgi:hypothetical protein
MKLALGTMLLALTSAACLTAGSGQVKLHPDAQSVRFVRNPDQVHDCVRLRSVQVSDGIGRREENRVQEGHQKRAHNRLKVITAREGGDTALINDESFRLNLEPPTMVWILDADIFQCNVQRAEAGR